MDLNLVRVFVAVYEARSLTIAAARLYVTPSAVSQALGRLRRHFDDPLFERAGREMRATPVASDVYQDFREALTRIDRSLDTAHGFDAAASERTFRIALSELGEIGWFPALFDAVRTSAPGVRLEVVPLDPSALREWLARGSVDLAVTPASLPLEFERRFVKQQRYDVVMSSRHPLASGALSLDDYASAAHVEVSSDSGAPLIEEARLRAGVRLHPLVAVQHFATVPQLLLRSPAVVATIPEVIAAGWAANWPLAIRELPFDMPALELNMYRRRTTQSMGALDWLCDTVADAITGSEGEFSAISAEERRP